MKLYTRPRLIPVAYVVALTDEAAMDENGEFVTSLTDYVTLDMDGKVRWSPVVAVSTALAPATTLDMADVGIVIWGGDVVVRQSISIDPWSYVKS
jgi:hypothetical protein